MLEGSDNSQLGSGECRKQAKVRLIVRRRVTVARWARLDEAQDLEFSLWCIYNPSIISKPQDLNAHIITMYRRRDHYLYQRAVVIVP
jgi:hypothetical protein